MYEKAAMWARTLLRTPTIPAQKLFTPPTENSRRRAKLRKREIELRIETLRALIARHSDDGDFRRSVSDWRRELGDLRLQL
jgi:hypothetical protein